MDHHSENCTKAHNHKLLDLAFRLTLTKTIIKPLIKDSILLGTVSEL